MQKESVIVYMSTAITAMVRKCDNPVNVTYPESVVYRLKQFTETDKYLRNYQRTIRIVPTWV
jgi:hypothetical protein